MSGILSRIPIYFTIHQKVQIDDSIYYGINTLRAKNNFNISGIKSRDRDHIRAMAIVESQQNPEFAQWCLEEVQIDDSIYYGINTLRAKNNFNISGIKSRDRDHIRAMAIVKYDTMVVSKAFKKDPWVGI